MRKALSIFVAAGLLSAGAANAHIPEGAVWLAWQWPMFHQQLAAWAPSAWYIDWASSWSFIASALSFPNTFVFWATAGMICLILLLAVEPLFTED